MLLEEKLRQLRTAIGSPTPRRLSSSPNLDGWLGGRIYETSLGQCYLVEQYFPLHYRHGRVPLDAARGIGGRVLALLARRSWPDGVTLEQAVFLDTETTGLSGGTGTYAFLIGLGFFQQEAFVVQQYLMRDYAEEEALLEAVREVLARFPVLVTFNGKSFDLPLLDTRYLLVRRQRLLEGYLHLDLLHPARRLWRHRLESCRLSHVEAVFDHRRLGDIPSWTIPSLYFAFVRRGEAAPLQQVFEHNRQDILSLAALAAHVGYLLEHPDEEGWSAEEVYEAARLYEDQRHEAEAATFYARAWSLAPNLRTGHAAAARVAALHKRARRSDLALPLWERMAANASPLGLRSCVELAKYYEHEVRDRAEALRQTRRALDLLEVLDLVSTHGLVLQQERRALEHRLARLARRLRLERASGR